MHGDNDWRGGASARNFFTTIGHLTKLIQFMNFDKKNWVNNSCKKNFARKVTKYGT